MEFKNSKFYQKLIGFLKQGLSSRQLALTIMISTIFGIMPLLIVNTWIISAVVILFRLNLPLAIFINYAIWPIHVLLIIPFIKFGTWLSGASMTGLTLSHFQEAFSYGILNGLQDLGIQVTYGLLGWTVISIPLSITLYFLVEFAINIYYKKN